jgi:5-(hydroxymethyl)furfural/furfural oxidase
MPVRRLARSRWAPFAAAIGDALQRRGFPYLEDYNSDFREGFSSVPTNCTFDHRMSASMAYLTRDVRRRTNLTILTNAKVRRLSLTGKRVDGVFVNIDDRLLMIGARQVIVSCGALQSPTLLMRSGIGPSKHLVEHGIVVARHLAGVGANLQNHPCVTLTAYLPREAAQTRENVWFAQNWLRFSSEQPGCERNDMHLLVFNKCAWHGLGSRVGALVVSVLNSYSKGRVQLSSTEDPQIQFNFLADTRDFERLVTGLRLTLGLLVDAGVERMRREIFLPNPDTVGSLARRNTWNRLRASAITLTLDHASLRRRLFAHARIDPERLLADTDALRDFVRRHASMQLHVCGTCRLGAADDPDAVVDGSGKVHGIAGLRVADASIFPTVLRGYTHFPVIMAAEKIADAVRTEWGSRSEDMQSLSALTQ